MSEVDKLKERGVALKQLTVITSLIRMVIPSCP
jgi:hypothetical protein